MDPRPICELCQSPLSEAACPCCPPGLRAAVSGWAAGSFPRTALAPDGAGDARLVSALAQALADGDLAAADAHWAALASGLRPLGPAGRRLLGDCFDAWASLKAARGLDAEAARLRQRAVSARKDPEALRLHQASRADGSGGWDNHAWLKLQAGDVMPDQEVVVARVRQELDRQMAAAERRWRAWKIAGASFAGFIGSGLLGIPLLVGSAVGASLGWWWGRPK